MGSFSILNNIAGINGQNQLSVNSVNLNRTLNRLSSGKRINSGADDAAGLQIADSLKANVAALNQAVRNANDGISVAQIADGALAQVTDLLTRGVTLAEEAATETIDSNGKKALQKEFDAIKAEIDRIALATNFNGQKIFAGTISTDALHDGKLNVFVGDISNASTAAASAIELKIGGIDITNTLTSNKNGLDNFDTTAIGDIDLTLAADNASGAAGSGHKHAAATALTKLKEALNAVSTMRGSIGAGMNRLQAAVNVLQTQSQNTQAAESAIRDANVAEEISNMTKYQILAQSGIAALAQANSNSQNVLSLLR